MRFISKSSNLLIVLKPGLQAQPITGTPAVNMLSVRFKDGLADVSDQEKIKLMLAHPGFNQDFVSAEDVGGIDPYMLMREESEPAHMHTELKYGTPVGRSVVGGAKPKLSPEMARLIQEMATDVAKQMLPGMMEVALKQLVKDHDTMKHVPETAEKIETTEKTEAPKTIKTTKTDNPRAKDAE